MTKSDAASTDQSEGDLAASRRLLGRLRDLMAGSGSASEKLDKIVRVVAAEQHADVCSCYVTRAGEVLELFATVGLRAESVRKTRLRMAEGLVGSVASSGRPLALSQAQSHPNFVYRPETGEEIYSSFCGVPILRGGRVRGVLVIQSRARHSYTALEIETLETIAMIVAELFAAGDLVADAEIVGGSDPSLRSLRLEGITLNAGIGIGTAVLHRPSLPSREVIADDPVAETARLHDALEQMQDAVDRLVATAHAAGIGEHREIIEAYRLFANDRSWEQRLLEAVEQGLTAEAAVQRVQNENRLRLSSTTNPYLRERMLDLDDLAYRLLSHLAGWERARDMLGGPADPVVVARSMGPAELLDYEQNRPRALVLEEGAVTSHVSIIAKALEIPVVGRCAGALTQIEPLDELIVDGDGGAVYVRPGEDVAEAYQQVARTRLRQRAAYAELRDAPGRTADGLHIRLMINASLSVELNSLAQSGAEGVGLYRTEIPFMVRAAYPDIAAQTQLYRRAYELCGGRPIVFRTLDVGGDKRLPFFPAQNETNPALGWRALRIGLDRPAMLRGQIRALLQAAGGNPLSLMFPLVAHAGEFEAARRLVDREIERLRQGDGELPSEIHVGAMIEVPAVLWELDRLCRSADFLSIGSNDLMQYLFAADRENPRLTQRYDPLSAPVLRALKAVQRAGAEAAIPVSVCGEMAGRPLEALALVALGYESLSMASSSVGAIKAMLRTLDAGAARDYLDRIIEGPAHSLRPQLLAFAKDRGIAL